MLIRALVVVLAYVLATRLINPGFIEWGVPLHSDDWQYFATSRTGFKARDLIHVRPLMTLTLKLLGFISDPKAFVTALLIPAILLPYFILAVAEVFVGEKLSHLSALVYSFLCFSLSTFYELSMLDFGGVMAGLVACVYVLVLKQASTCIDSADHLLTKKLMFTLFLTWVSIEFKPTYGLVMVALPFLLIQKIGWRRAMAQAALTGFIVLMVMFKDILLGSPFILLHAGASNTYAVAKTPASVAHAFAYYAKWFLPLAAWPMLIVATARLLWLRQRIIVLVISAIAVLAIIPMLAIPTHLVPMYSWYSSSIGLLLVPLSISPKFGSKREFSIYIGLLLLAAPFIIAMWAIYRDAPEYRSWYAANQRSNANALTALKTLSSVIQPGDRVLIAGVLNAYSPFKVDEFITSFFPYRFDWNIATPRRDLSLINRSPKLDHMIPAKDIVPNRYNVVIYFDRAGNLLHIASANELLKLDPSHRIAAMFCNSWTLIPSAETVMCLYAIDENETIVLLSNLGPVTGSNAWTWFALGHAQEALGHFPQAHDAYVKAATGYKSGIFVDSVRRTEMPSMEKPAENKKNE